MEITVRDGQKQVEIWLTNREQQDPQIQAQLKPLYREYGQKKYTVAVFQSGSRDLYQSTRELLGYNRRRLAELEVLREKQAHST